MTESEARDVVLVRAWEIGPVGGVEQGRRRAGEPRGRASRRRAGIARTADRRRAALAAARLGEREPAVRQALRASRAPRWVGWASCRVGIRIGLASDALGPARRIDLLAPALLALLAWNLAVYLLLAGERTAREGDAPFGRCDARCPARCVRRARLPPALSADSSPTGRRQPCRSIAARIASLLHARCGARRRRAGLDVPARPRLRVPRRLGEHVPDARGGAPAAVGRARPGVSAQRHRAARRRALGALRWSAGPGENAARWIHLHAITMALVVLLPRALLALRSALARAAAGARIPAAARRCVLRRAAARARGEPLPVQRAALQLPPAAGSAATRCARRSSAASARRSQLRRARRRSRSAAKTTPRRAAATPRRRPRGRRCAVRADRHAGARAPRRVRARWPLPARRAAAGAGRRIGLPPPLRRRRGERVEQRRDAWRSVLQRRRHRAGVRRPGIARSTSAARRLAAHAAGTMTEPGTHRAQPGLAHQRRQDHARAHAAAAATSAKCATRRT